MLYNTALEDPILLSVLSHEQLSMSLQLLAKKSTYTQTNGR